MAEINAVEHVAKIFAVAQKLMKARQDSALAKLVADSAAKELALINGGTERIDLGDYDGRRFFECEGDRTIRLKYGQANEALTSNPAWKCPAILAFESWMLSRTEGPKPEELLCNDCKQALALHRKDNPPPPEVAVEAKPIEAKPSTPKKTSKTKVEEVDDGF